MGEIDKLEGLLADVVDEIKMYEPVPTTTDIRDVLTRRVLPLLQAGAVLYETAPLWARKEYDAALERALGAS